MNMRIEVDVRLRSAKGGRPTTDESRRKLAGVLAIARAQFCLLGYRAVTMRMVAEKAGVSTRTLYDNHADKLSLFAACLEVGADAFPKIEHVPGAPDAILLEYAISLVKVLSTDSSLRLGLLVYREGSEFPELVRAAEANQEAHLVKPLAAYLKHAGLTKGDDHEMANLFLLMALSDWQRRLSFLHPMPELRDIESHARLVVRLFLDGARAQPIELYL